MVLGAWACSGQRGTPSAASPSPSPNPSASTAPSGAPGVVTQEDLDKPLPSPLPDVAARVNGQVIPIRTVAAVARQAAGNDAVPAEKQPGIVRRAMYQLIVRELLFQEATRRGLKPDEKASRQAYDEARIAYKDDKVWTEELRKRGLDDAAFRAELRVQLTVQTLLNEEAKAIPEPAEEEIRAFYNNNPASFETGERLRARHILIRLPEQSIPLQKDLLHRKAEETLARLKNGEDFATLAKSVSQDPGSAGKGGELPVFHRGDMPPSFEQAAYALKPGQLSEVVESPFGFHIIKLIERLPGETVTYAHAHQQIRDYLRKEKGTTAVEGLITSLKAKARIETYL
jgi:peptidyl-prolyl cis-trans isomerase C